MEKIILGHKFGATIEGLNLPTPTTPSTIFSTRKINYTYVYSRRRTITPVNSCFQIQRDTKPIPPDPQVYTSVYSIQVNRSRKKFTILSSSGIAKKNGRDYASRRVRRRKKEAEGHRPLRRRGFVPDNEEKRKDCQKAEGSAEVRHPRSSPFFFRWLVANKRKPPLSQLIFHGTDRRQIATGRYRPLFKRTGTRSNPWSWREIGEE